MKLTREAVLRIAHKCVSEEQIAALLGWKGDLEDLVVRLAGLIPGYEAILARNEAYQLMLENAHAGFHEEKLAARQEFFKQNDQVILSGLTLTPSFGSPPRKKKAEAEATAGDIVHKVAEKTPKKGIAVSQKSKAEAEFGTLALLPTEVLVGVAFHGQVGDTGRDYCGKQLAVVRLRQGLFGGTGSPKGACFPEDVYKYYTVTNGFINQCDITKDGTPTPYWSVMQAMIELQSWKKKDEVVQKAITFVPGMEKACSTAYDVLKTHCYHPCKRYAGMGFMVDEAKTETGKVFTLRARNEQETVEYLQEQRAKKVEKEEEPPLATHFV